jgi:hypothetical protein
MDISSQLKKKQRRIVFFAFIVLLHNASVGAIYPNDLDEDESPPGILGKVRNFLGELGHIAHEVTNGIQKLNRQIRTVEDFLDATVDEDCFFECPSGKGESFSIKKPASIFERLKHLQLKF